MVDRKNGCITDSSQIMAMLEAAADPSHLSKMARFGIVGDDPFGVPVPVLRQIARQCGKSLALADELWNTGRHEARILASMVAPPKEFTKNMMDGWTQEFRSWDICDGCCGNLFRYTPYGFGKIAEYARRDEEYVRRAGFGLAAAYAIGDKTRDDADFMLVLALVEEFAGDSRNFVRKAVNWALRQIGKRSHALRAASLETANRLIATGNKSARWVGSDAARELTDPRIIARIKR